MAKTFGLAIPKNEIIVKEVFCPFKNVPWNLFIEKEILLTRNVDVVLWYQGCSDKKKQLRNGHVRKVFHTCSVEIC